MQKQKQRLMERSLGKWPKENLDFYFLKNEKNIFHLKLKLLLILKIFLIN